MARTTATNFTGGLQFPYATAATDLFKKEDVQTLALAVDGHDHTSGKGLGLGAGAIGTGLITSAMIADGTIATGDLADGSVATAKLADSAVSNQKLGADAPRLNLLANGGFELWQRGTGPFTTSNAYTADRWLTTIGGTSTMSISRDTANADATGGACAAVSYTHNAASFLSQKVEDLQLRRVVAWSMRVRSGTASGVRLQLYHSTSTLIASSSYHTGSGTYQTLSVSGTVPAGATNIYLSVSFEATGTYYLDNSMLVVGSVAADYAPLNPTDDLAFCQRYYEVLGPNATGSLEISASNASAGSGSPVQTLRYVSKSVTPTITKVGTWNTSNCGQPTVNGADLESFYLQTTVTAAGSFATFNGTAGNKVTVEANP